MRARPKRWRRSLATSGVGWIEAEDNPWGVRILDMRAITQATVTPIPETDDDGRGFVGQAPPVPRRISAALQYPGLADGALFRPRAKEHRWAIYLHGGHILFVGRVLQVIGEVTPHGDLNAIEGVFTEEQEAPELTVRILDFLMRSHVLRAPALAPLRADLAEDAEAQSRWCLSAYGSLASFGSL